MQVPLQISFHEVDHSDAVEERIREKVAKLEQYYDNITSCRVVIERPHRHHQHGQLFNVHVDVTLPGCEIMVKGDKGDAHEDVFVAIREAFDGVRRQLKAKAQQQRRSDKRHRGQKDADLDMVD